MKSAEAIILAKRSFGEADEIIVALTKDYGKLNFRSRGAKRSGAKLSGGLQELNRLDIYFATGRGLPIITDLRGRQSFPNIKSSLAKLRSAAAGAETLEKITPDGSPESATGDIILFAQLSSYLYALENYDGRDENISLAPLFFIYQTLTAHGFRPELEKCAICGRAIAGASNLSFSPASGGVIDERCLKRDPTALAISAEALSLLKWWCTAAPQEILADKRSFARRAELARIIERFAQWHLGFPIELKL